MPTRACDLHRGALVSIDGLPHALEQLTVTNPSARGAATLYRFRFRNLVSKAKIDKICKGDDLFQDCDLEKRDIQFLYSDNSGRYTFMDAEDFSQFEMDAEALGDKVHFLSEDLEGLYALVSDGKVLAVGVPAKVVVRIAECDPPMKGATVTSRPKPAKTATGLVVMVPEYLEAGTDVVVNTEDGAFVSRA